MSAPRPSAGVRHFPPRRTPPADPSLALPRYELRSRVYAPGDTQLEVWQLPSPATPRLSGPVRVAGLRGRNLELIEHRVASRLKQGGIRPGVAKGALPGGREAIALPEELALTLGLIFRALAPMRSRDNLRAVVEGIEVMGKEEAAYWLGMAMHRRNPRRVLTALRVLLTAPRPKAAEPLHALK
jgi:hypothetical protein